MHHACQKARQDPTMGLVLLEMIPRLQLYSCPTHQLISAEAIHCPLEDAKGRGEELELINSLPFEVDRTRTTSGKVPLAPKAALAVDLLEFHNGPSHFMKDADSKLLSDILSRSPGGKDAVAVYCEEK